MTEQSYFWDGLVTGDAATLAPYSSLEYGTYIQFMLDSELEEAYVLPGYTNELAVTQQTSITMGVSVATGALTIFGKVYENTASTNLTVSASNATLARVDSVVATVDFLAQTIRLEVVEGEFASSNPEPPTLSSTSTEKQIELARIYVRPEAVAIINNDIEERRIFAYNNNNAYYTDTNLLINSEFLAYNKATFPATTAPEVWAQYSSTFNANLNVTTKPDQMVRGRALSINSTTDNLVGLKQTINIKGSTRYSIRLLIKVTEADAGASVVVSTNSAAPISTTKSIANPINEWKDIWIYFTTESDATSLTLSVVCANTTIYLGQCLVVEGYTLGLYGIKREQITFANNTEFYVTTSSTTDDVTIDFDAQLTSCAPVGVYAVFFTIEAFPNGGASDGEIRVKDRFNETTTDWSMGHLKLDTADTNGNKSLTGVIGLYPSLTNTEPRTFTVRGGVGLNLTIRIIGVIY